MLTKQAVMKETGANDTLVSFWAQKLADTDLVSEGKFFSPDFCTFVSARIGKQGRPVYLPEPQRIEELFHLWHEHEGKVEAIAGDKNAGIVQIELREVGLIKEERSDDRGENAPNAGQQGDV